jgi:hypothetical protein
MAGEASLERGDHPSQQCLSTPLVRNIIARQINQISLALPRPVFSRSQNKQLLRPNKTAGIDILSKRGNMLIGLIQSD